MCVWSYVYAHIYVFVRTLDAVKRTYLERERGERERERERERELLLSVRFDDDDDDDDVCMILGRNLVDEKILVDWKEFIPFFKKFFLLTNKET